MTDENAPSDGAPAETTPPAKKAASKRPARKAVTTQRAARAKQVAVRLTRKSRGFDVGQELDVDEDRAAELVDSGQASYLE